MIPPIFSQGLRPFFLAAGLWGALSMALWIGVLAGLPTLPLALDPLAWHAHEMTFGYVGASVAGFLMTAGPSWTKQPALRGGPLAALFVLWVLGRVAMLAAGHAPPWLVAVADLALPLAIMGIFLRMILRAAHWRQLSVFAGLALLVLGNLLFHIEAAGMDALAGLGMRLGLAGGLVLVSIVGGRVVPNFTRNWLKRTGRGPLEPTPHDGAFNTGLGSVLVVWALWPDHLVSAALLTLAGLAHVWRLLQWRGLATGSEALVWVLHLAYAFVPLGALAMAGAILAGLPGASALHVWTVGALGLMTMAIMTRATLGHTGGPLTAGPGTATIYGLIAMAAILRPLAGLTGFLVLQDLAALAWIVAFLGFVLGYGGRHLRPAPAT